MARGKNLLPAHRAPPRAILGACMLGACILGVLWMLMHAKLELLASHFHDHDGSLHAPLPAFGTMLLFPLSAFGAIVLVIPLIAYVADHAAFVGLQLPRPDHYCILLRRFYGALIAGGGKVAGKDL